MTNTPDTPLNPGDEAPEDTPGTGEDVCPVCQGTGHAPDTDEDKPCTNCGGTGVINEGIGGG